MIIDDDPLFELLNTCKSERTKEELIKERNKLREELEKKQLLDEIEILKKKINGDSSYMVRINY